MPRAQPDHVLWLLSLLVEALLLFSPTWVSINNSQATYATRDTGL